MSSQFIQPRPVDPANSRTGVALALGIGSMAVCVLSLGLLAPVALPAGVAAIVMGTRARRRGAGRRDQATGAVWTGAAGVALSILALVFWVLLVMIGGLAIEFLGGLDEWLEMPAPTSPIDPPADEI